jgi:long-chain acyl-CoA synthetase
MNYFSKIDQFKDNIALVTETENFTYNSLIDHSKKITKNIKERSVVMIVCSNTFEIIAAYVGFIRLNCVVILIDNNLLDSNFKKIITEYKPNYIFKEKKKNTISINYNHLINFYNFELLENKEKNNYLVNDKLTMLITTSGSTGSAKFVRISYENIDKNLYQVIDSLNISSEDRSITTMPLNYIYGLSIVNSHLCAGASIIVNKYSLINKKFWELFNNKKASNFNGVPFMYEILDKIDFKTKVGKNLKYLTQAGGKLSTNLIEKFYKIGLEKKINFITMYGQTEATSRMSYLPWDSLKNKIGSIGKPVKDGKFSIIDNNGVFINDVNKIGELVYEGKNVSLGYAMNYLDLEKGDSNNGKLFTGDLVKKDKDDFYFITGRLKRISKIFGIRINLDEVEMLIKNIGFECACTGNDDKLKIFFEEDFNNLELIDTISKLIGIHKSGISLEKVLKIPRNQTGKILYKELN